MKVREMSKEEYNQYRKDLYAKDPEKVCARLRERWARLGLAPRYKQYKKNFKMRSPEEYLIRCSKERAKKYGIPFAITVEDIHIPDRCPVFGTAWEIADNGPSNFSMTLDRLDPKKGYTPDNIAVISGRANRVKSDLTLIELESLVNWLKEKVNYV